MSSLGIEPRPHWWEASDRTSSSALLHDSCHKWYCFRRDKISLRAIFSTFFFCSLPIRKFDCRWVMNIFKSRPQSPLFFWSAIRTRTLATCKAGSPQITDFRLVYAYSKFWNNSGCQRLQKWTFTTYAHKLEVRVLGADQKKSGLWGRDWRSSGCNAHAWGDILFWNSVFFRILYWF